MSISTKFTFQLLLSKVHSPACSLVLKTEQEGLHHFSWESVPEPNRSQS